MDSKQIDTAMREKTLVIYEGVQYKQVLECVLWYNKTGKRRLSAVLLSMDGRYTVRVPAERVELLREDSHV